MIRNRIGLESLRNQGTSGASRRAPPLEAGCGSIEATPSPCRILPLCRLLSRLSSRPFRPLDPFRRQGPFYPSPLPRCSRSPLFHGLLPCSPCLHPTRTPPHSLPSSRP